MKAKILFALLIYCFFCGKTLAQNAQEILLESKASNFISLLRAGDYEGAAELFHFPEYYSKQELDKDKRSICNVLELVTDELGIISEVKKVANWPTHYHVGVAGGKTAYWKKYPHQYRLNFEVEFKKDGLGYIFLYFNKINSAWKVSRADYALPASNDHSKKRTLTLIKKINKIIQ